jgi:hypothetical protein
MMITTICAILLRLAVDRHHADQIQDQDDDKEGDQDAD